MAGENKYIICCDFDGVLNSYKSGWQGANVISDPPVPGAMKWLAEMTVEDENFEKFEIDIYSSRSKELGGIEAMKEWLRTHLIGYFMDEANPYAGDAAEIVLSRLSFPTQKPAASMTIDDRAFCFEGKFPSARWLLAFKPWNKGGATSVTERRAALIREIIERAISITNSKTPHARVLFATLDSITQEECDLLGVADDAWEDVTIDRSEGL